MGRMVFLVSVCPEPVEGLHFSFIGKKRKNEASTGSAQTTRVKSS